MIAVGTTSVRSLESAWDVEAGKLLPRERAATSLYLLPGSEFHVVDALVTNFHVPRSTLMMLVSAFSSRDNVMAAYQHAIQQRYGVDAPAHTAACRHSTVPAGANSSGICNAFVMVKPQYLHK